MQNNVQGVTNLTGVTKTIHVTSEKVSLDGPPLDYSFKNIKDLSEIRSMEPRQGKRKPIQIEQEELKDDIKKESQDSQQNKQVDQSSKSDKDDKEKGEQENDDQKQDDKNETDDKDKKEEIRRKGPEIIRVVPQHNINNIIATHNIPLNNTLNKATGGKNYEENNNMFSKKVVKVKLLCVSLILSYNKIYSLDNFYPIMDSVMYDFSSLRWIDLSHNHLVTLSYDFSDLKSLQTLYLHVNFIKDLNEIAKLALIPLKNLTIHGNPIETIPNFRLYIIRLLPYLQRLDTVLISRKERDNANVWAEKFRMIALPEAKNPLKPPVDNNNTNPIDQNKQISSY